MLRWSLIVVVFVALGKEAVRAIMRPASKNEGRLYAKY
jgi:uncharacterized DUF497 family protein